MATRIETHTYEHFGDDKVSTAAELLAKLPNGWSLKRFEHRVEHGVGSWIAVVQGPEQRDL